MPAHLACDTSAAVVVSLNSYVCALERHLCCAVQTPAPELTQLRLMTCFNNSGNGNAFAMLAAGAETQKRRAHARAPQMLMAMTARRCGVTWKWTSALRSTRMGTIATFLDSCTCAPRARPRHTEKPGSSFFGPRCLSLSDLFGSVISCTVRSFRPSHAHVRVSPQLLSIQPVRYFRLPGSPLRAPVPLRALHSTHTTAHAQSGYPGSMIVRLQTAVPQTVTEGTPNSTCNCGSCFGGRHGSERLTLLRGALSRDHVEPARRSAHCVPPGKRNGALLALVNVN